MTMSRLFIKSIPQSLKLINTANWYHIPCFQFSDHFFKLSQSSMGLSEREAKCIDHCECKAGYSLATGCSRIQICEAKVGTKFCWS